MKIVDVIAKFDKEVDEWLCVIYVDSKSQISDTIKGLPSNIRLAAGSLLYTGALEVGVYKEDGSWGWK